MIATVYPVLIIYATHVLDGKVVNNVRTMPQSTVRHVSVTNFTMRSMTNVTHVIPVVLSAMVQITTNVPNVALISSNRSTLIYVLIGVQQVRLAIVN